MKSNFYLRILAGMLSVYSIISCNPPEPSKTPSNANIDHNVLLWVGAYTRTEGHVDGKAEGVYALEFDTLTGKLTKTNIGANTINPSFLALDKESNLVFAVNEIADDSPDGGGRVSSFAFNVNDSTLARVDSSSALGGAPCHISTNQNHVLIANYVGGNIALYEYDTDGNLSFKDEVAFSGKGPHPNQQSPHAHMIVTNPHTGQIFSTDLGTDTVRIFDFDHTKGQLRKVGFLKIPDGYGPRHMDFHPSQDIVYVVNELFGSVSVFTRDEDGYSLKQTVSSTLNEDQTIAACADIHVHPDGAFLYVSNRGNYNSITAYRIGEEGSLTLVSEHSVKGQIPRSFTIDPSGKFLLVANQNSNNIVVFEIEKTSGRLLDIRSEINAPTPVCLKF